MNRMDAPSYPDLLQLLAKGDEVAFETIFRNFYKKLYLYARKNIPVKEDCEEIVQDAFEYLWDKREVSNIENLESYLFNIVRYKVVGYFRQSAVRKRYADHFKIFHVLYENSEQLEVDPGEASGLIQKSISSLPKRYQEVINLRLHDELSNEDIARQLKVSKQTVEVYVSRGLDLLRESFKGKERPI